MDERARATAKRSPRPCRAGRALLAAVAILAGGAAADRVLAQSSVPELFDPTLDVDTRNAPSFSGGSTTPARIPNRFQPRVLTDGNPPASGAGETGFVSRNPPAQQRSLPLTPSGEATGSFPPTLLSEPNAIEDAGDTPSRPRRRRAPNDDPYAPLGIRAGSFVLKPAIEISGGLDSNPARVPVARGGNVLVVAPELQVRSDWSRHELSADVRGRYMTYPGFTAVPSLNQPFLDSRLAARIDVTRRTRLDLEGRFLVSTENPNSPDLPASLAKLPITMTVGTTAGVTQEFNRLALGISGSYDRVTYDDSLLTTGATVSNRDRNYDQTGMKLRGSYEMTPGIKPFVEVAFDRRVHDLPVDSSGFHRDSTGGQVLAGTTFELTRQLTGSIAAGYAVRRYNDPALVDPSGLIADGSLVWTATPLTTATFTARSQIAESTLPGVSAVLRRDFGAEVDHAWRRWLIGTVKFGYGLDDYVGSARVDQRYVLSGLLTYRLSREVQLKGEVRRQWLKSNVAGADYTADIFLVGLRLQR